MTSKGDTFSVALLDDNHRKFALVHVETEEFPGWGTEQEMELIAPPSHHHHTKSDGHNTDGLDSSENVIEVSDTDGEDLIPEKPKRRAVKLTEFLATSICGNDILSSVLYCTGIVTVRAGKLAPLCITLVCLMLYLMRSIYEEGIMTLPLNGGCYSILLNTTSKRVACAAACLSVLTYTATGVVSAASAIDYISTVFPALDSEFYMILLLLIFACLTTFGLSESAQVAAGIFFFHLFTLSILVIFGLGYAFTHSAIFHDNLNSSYPDVEFVDTTLSGTFLIALFAGFSTSMLGITGFETSSQFVEEQAPRVFPLTLRNMWMCVMFFNPVISFLALFVMTVDEIIDHQDYVLVSMMRKIGNWICDDLGNNVSLGEVLGNLMAIDAFIVLAGSVLTSYVGINGLVRRLTNDRCLPSFLLTKNELRGTYHYILFGYFLISSSLVLLVNGNDDSVAGVYTFAFLGLMCFFCIGVMLLKYKRAELPREYVCPWWKIHLGLVMLVVGLIGNILVRTNVLSYFVLYYLCTGFVFLLMFERTSTLKVILNISRKVHPNFSWNTYIANVINESQECEFVFFAKTPTLSILNKAVLYVKNNESTNKITFIHCYDPSTMSEEQINETKSSFRSAVAIIDCIYPKVGTHLVFIKGPFTPKNVTYISQQLKISKNRMFIACPSTNFAHKIEFFGGVRIVTH